MIRLQNGLEALLVHNPEISSQQKSEEENEIKLLSAIPRIGTYA
ncbi:hypothetical protein A2U01_0077573, partial [Trifolium medium]|nr:hypothetical protein [Trifolium medium]